MTATCNNCFRNGNDCTHTEMPMAKWCSRWIAAKDAPVPAKKKAGEPISCDICAKEQCSIVHKGEYACVAFVAKHEPVKPVPVVRYWRSTIDSEFVYKTDENNVCIEHLKVPSLKGSRFNQDRWEDHDEITAADYEASKVPEKQGKPVAIEKSLCEQIEKIIKLIGELNDRLGAIEAWRSSGLNATATSGEAT